MPLPQGFEREHSAALAAPVGLLHMAHHVPPVEDLVEEDLLTVAALVDLWLSELEI